MRRKRADDFARPRPRKTEKSRRVLHPGGFRKVRSFWWSPQPRAYRRYLVCGHAWSL